MKKLILTLLCLISLFHASVPTEGDDKSGGMVAEAILCSSAISGGVFLAGATISGSGTSGFTDLAGSIDVKLSL